MDKPEFVCPITLATNPAEGTVSLTFGPIDAGNVVDLLRYLRRSDTFEDEVLDQVARNFALTLDRDTGA